MSCVDESIYPPWSFLLLSTATSFATNLILLVSDDNNENKNNEGPTHELLQDEEEERRALQVSFCGEKT